jgi:hypothetical protein
LLKHYFKRSAAASGSRKSIINREVMIEYAVDPWLVALRHLLSNFLNEDAGRIALDSEKGASIVSA